MNKLILIIFLLIASVFLAACEVEDTPTDVESPIEMECQTDNDCIKEGCSGTMCQTKNTEQVMTTCEWKEEYACYKQIACGCINNKCAWDKTEEFDTCIEEARKSGEEVIV